MTEKPPRPLWNLSKGSALLLCALVAGLELWAQSATDPDFWFLDPFRSLVLYVVALWLVSGFLPWKVVRVNVRLVLGLFVVGGVLVVEIQSRDRDVDIAHSRIELSPDPLLRYQYRPGTVVRDADTSGRTPPVNSVGLWDDEHAVPKPADVYRVVVLGDSVPNDASIGFVDRFPQQIERGLNAQLAGAAGGRRVEVVNVSCEGYNTLQEVRLLERVGLRYEPDLVVVAYVLNDPFLQNGGYRRLGNSFFIFRVLPMFHKKVHGSQCRFLTPLYDRYAFNLAVREPLERLGLLAQLHHFKVAVAVLPVMEPFDDPDCLAMYDQVAKVAADQGFPAIRLIDEFKGKDPVPFLRPQDPWDIFHPTVEGHTLYAKGIVKGLGAAFEELRPPAPPTSATP
jgi:hypothetical protein